MAKSTLLIISQAYPPDPTAVGLQLADVAQEMATRGWQVDVLTARRGYDDPTIKYPWRENCGNVRIRRLPFSSFGKSSIFHRLLGQFLFIFQVTLYGVLRVKSFTKILISTSPPIGPLAALLIKLIRSTPIVYWVMDINPDQAIALGKFSPRSLFSRALEKLNRLILHHSETVITLDQYMAKRLQSKKEPPSPIEIIPPWPHQQHLTAIAHHENPFRQHHNLQDKFTFMYSGNMSPASPVTAIIKAALLLTNQPDLIFIFIGGGEGKHELDKAIAERNPTNIISLPYQPIDQIKYSLSAADIHIVTMGKDMVGIIHPSKVYSAMTLGKPVFFLGPKRSHITELMKKSCFGWQQEDDDPTKIAATLLTISKTPHSELQSLGQSGQKLITAKHGKPLLCKKLCDMIEK